MKKIINILLLGALLGFVCISCNDDTEEYFDQSASERISTSMDKYNTALKSASQGWIFQYFPDDDQEYGGFNYIVKFNEKDSCTVWSELMGDISKPETSLYTFTQEGGPMLSFYSYNEVLMLDFATPNQAEYQAKQGDFEFLMVSLEQDTINLKGNKYPNKMRLIKLNETPEAYFAKVANIESFITSVMESTIGDKNVEVFVNASNRQITFSYKDGDKTKTETIAYICTDTGIRLYRPLIIDTISVKDFTLMEQEKAFVSTDKSVTLKLIFPPVDLTKALWSLDIQTTTDRSDAIAEAWQKASDGNSAALFGIKTSTSVFMGLVSAGAVGLSMPSYWDINKPFIPFYKLAFAGVKGHKDYMSISGIEAGPLWETYFTQLSPMPDIITSNSAYKVELDNEENPTVAKFTSLNNPNVWFVLRKH